jgi:hypothetical protein
VGCAFLRRAFPRFHLGLKLFSFAKILLNPRAFAKAVKAFCSGMEIDFA